MYFHKCVIYQRIYDKNMSVRHVDSPQIHLSELNAIIQDSETPKFLSNISSVSNSSEQDLS